MRLLLLLLFTFLTPVVIFITSILDISDFNVILKDELASAHVYDKLSKQLANLDNQDPQSQSLNIILQKRFTPVYIQSKAETTIDASYDWIIGKSAIPPVLSFKDVKDDILAQNPQLINSIENLTQEAKNQPVQQDAQSDTASTDQTNLQMQNGIDTLNSLVKSDFSIKLDKYLLGIKNFYSVIRLFQPILAGLLLLCFILLFVLSKSCPSRFKWIGATLMINGILGFGAAFFNTFLINTLAYFASANSNQLVILISPIILQVIKHFASNYVNFQKIVSVVFLIAAVICFVSAIFTKSNTGVVSKTKAVKKK